jgi:hypothetical protein
MTILTVAISALIPLIGLIQLLIGISTKSTKEKVKEQEEQLIELEKSMKEAEKATAALQRLYDEKLANLQNLLFKKLEEILEQTRDFKLQYEKDSGKLQTTLVKDYVSNEKFEKFSELVIKKLDQLPCNHGSGKSCN